MEYENAGDFTKEGRIKTSLWVNGVFYLVIGIVGIVFITYLIIKNTMTLDRVIGLLMAMSNSL